MKYITDEEETCWIDESGKILDVIYARIINSEGDTFIDSAPPDMGLNELHTDEEGFVHNEEGPAVVLYRTYPQYIYYWHGNHIWKEITRP